MFKFKPMYDNPEKLSEQEIGNKILYLEKNIRKSIILLGTDKYCKNRINRINVLKSYL